jgi:hypothetical protein
MSVPTPSPALRRTVRGGVVAASVAAAGFLALSAETIAVGGVHEYRDFFWNLPGAATLVAFSAVHAVQRDRSGRFETAAYWTVQVGLAAALVGNNARALDVDALAWLGFPVGALLWMGGLIAFGIATMRARVLPSSAGLGLVLLEPASILTGLAFAPLVGLSDHGAYSGALPKAVALFLVARGLRSLVSSTRAGGRAAAPAGSSAVMSAAR